MRLGLARRRRRGARLPRSASSLAWRAARRPPAISLAGNPANSLLLPDHRRCTACTSSAGSSRSARVDRRAPGADARRERLRLERRSLRASTGTSCCVVWLVLFGLLCRLGRRLRRHLPPVADLRRIDAWPRPTCAIRRDAARPAGLARHRRRLVLRPARVQERLLGQGHDVDLPAQRHLHLRLLPARPT